MEREGLLFVISAPSGAGKTSLCREVIDNLGGLRHSVSYTTRAPRGGEQDGVDYHFVSVERFEAMVAAGEFAEWAQVHGNRYGTAIATLDAARRAGVDLLLDIDCQGAAQLKQNYRHGVFVFILPPSYQELQRRLEGRKTDAPDVIARRLVNARGEIEAARWYDYLVVNDDFVLARTNLLAILSAERCRTSRVLGSLTEFFAPSGCSLSRER